jgi:hypothetical protein
MEIIKKFFAQEKRERKNQEFISEESVKKFIEDIKDRFEEIFQNLHPEVIREILESDLIIGEDASGRLPALFLYKLSKFFREQREDKKNQKDPLLLFFSGFRNVSLAGNKSEKFETNRKENIKVKLINFIEKHFGDRDINITIVTDSIVTGESIGPLIDSVALVLKELKEKKLINDIKMRLITLSYLDRILLTSDFIEKVKKQLDISLKIYAASSESVPLIYGKHYITGVKKSNNLNIYSNLFLKRNKLLMNIARKKISLLAKELFEKIKTELNKE